jgi:hypothetical protein
MHENTPKMERWDRLNFAFEYLVQFISTKPIEARYEIAPAELALVSNFKGGNNSVVEPLQNLVVKLPRYSRQLFELGKLVADRDLRQMFQTVEQLSAEAIAFLSLTEQDETAISGFPASYASALLAAYFPRTLPVIDRQVLRGASIDHDVDAGGQVLKIAKHYPTLLKRFLAELEIRPDLSVRTLDREWFFRGSQLNRARKAEECP